MNKSFHNPSTSQEIEIIQTSTMKEKDEKQRQEDILKLSTKTIPYQSSSPLYHPNPT
jgi:hypothetical protein